MTSEVTNSINATTDSYVWRDMELQSNTNTEVDFNSHLLSALNDNSPKEFVDNNDKKSVSGYPNELSNIINPNIVLAKHNSNKEIQINSHNNHNSKTNVLRGINKNSPDTKIQGNKVEGKDKISTIKTKAENKSLINKKTIPKQLKLNEKIDNKLNNSIKTLKNPIKIQQEGKSIWSSKQLNNLDINNIKQFQLISNKLDSKIHSELGLKSLKLKTIKNDNSEIDLKPLAFGKRKNKKTFKIINNIDNNQNKDGNQVNKNNIIINPKEQNGISNNNIKSIISSKNILTSKLVKTIKQKSDNYVKKEEKRSNINNKTKSSKFDNISRLNNNKTKTKNNSVINQVVTKGKKQFITKTKEKNFQNLINSIKTISSNHSDNVNSANTTITNTYDSEHVVKIENLSKTITNISKNLQNNTYHTARLVMQPESLGTIIVKIIIQNNIAKLNINVGSEKAIKNIENQIGLLKSNLAQEGIKTEKIDISQQKNDGLDNKQEKRKNDNNKKNYQVVEDFVNSFKYIRE